MKVALVFPPLSDPTQAYSSLPVLTGFLRSRGRHEVRQIDANIGFFYWILADQRLTEAQALVTARVAALEDKASLSRDETLAHARAVDALMKAPFVMTGITEAVHALKQQETFASLERLNSAKRTLAEALELLSCASDSIPLSPTSGGPAVNAPADIRRWLSESGGNPLRAYLEDEIIPALTGSEAVGISITYRNQVVAAFMLASLLRDHRPDVPIILGGSIPSIWFDHLAGGGGLFEWCDYLVGFEGETALDQLLTCLETGSPVDAVPNLAYRRDGRVCITHRLIEDINSLPTPDYSGLDLDRYLAPEPVLLVYATRGCYWSRCAFCSVSPSMRGRYRMREPERVYRDLLTLHDKHGSRCFAFADDCVPPRMLRALSYRLARNGPKLSWQCEVRFEKAFDEAFLARLSRAGCKNLIFGLESYASEVLASMDKGVGSARIDRIIAGCRAVGIAFNLQFFFGFPGERPKDAAVTHEFILKQAHGQATFSFGTFELHRGSAVERAPGRYGIESVLDPGPLAIKLGHLPVAAHAAAARTALRNDLRRRLRFKHLDLSINAHTLMFLHVAGNESLCQLYGASPESAEEADLDSSLLRPGTRQVIGRFRLSPTDLPSDGEDMAPDLARRPVHLLYDYDLDQVVEVPELAVTILQRLSLGETPAGIAEALAKALGNEGDAQLLRGYVAEIVRSLHMRGFLKQQPLEQVECGR